MIHRVLSRFEILTLLQSVPEGSALAVSVGLGLYAGLRIQEISLINRSDIKRALVSGLFSVRKEIAKYKRPRTIPVCQSLAEILQDWYRFHKSEKKVVLWPCSLRTVQRNFSRFSAAVRVSFTPHDLRHTFGAVLYRECGDLSLVQSVLGHSNLKSTLIYVHIEGIVQQMINDAYDHHIAVKSRVRYSS